MVCTSVILGFFGTTASLACLALAQALVPAISTVPEVISSATITADMNSSVTADFIQVLRLKELWDLSPLLSMPTAGVVAEARPAAAAEELIDELSASQGYLAFACRCCLDLAVVVFTAIRLKPSGCKATPEDDNPVAQQQSKPHRIAAWSGREAEPHTDHSSARDLLLAWDSFA